MKKTIGLLFLMALSLCLPSCATPPPDVALHNGYVALAHSDYHAAYDDFSFAASYQFPDAYYALGYMHFKGLGVSQNTVKGLQWMRKAAVMNNPQAIEAIKTFKAAAPPRP